MELLHQLNKMDFEVLSWWGNLLNFLIFLFLAVNIVGTACFNVTQIYFSLFGLFASIFIQMISVFYRRML